MRLTTADLHELTPTLEALRPYLLELVLIGGWAHRLFALHPRARPRDFVPLTTKDVDFVIPPGVHEHAPAPISNLLEQAGFKPTLKSMHTRPPLTRYQGRNGLQVEFVADLKGSPTDRMGNSKDVIAVAGITAEQLRYVYPLEIRPW